MGYFTKIMIMLLFLWPSPSQAAQRLAGPYQAQVLEVIDGDTIRARIQIWLGQEIETLVRIDGIDTPEIKSRCKKEHTLALKAQKNLHDIIGSDAVFLHDIQFGKYAGRVLARVQNASGSDIAATLLSRNLAKSYKGKKRESWC